jgi:hypothetical protein
MRSSGGKPFGGRNRPSKPTAIEVAARVQAPLGERRLDAGEAGLAQLEPGIAASVR